RRLPQKSQRTNTCSHARQAWTRTSHDLGVALKHQGPLPFRYSQADCRSIALPKCGLGFSHSSRSVSTSTRFLSTPLPSQERANSRLPDRQKTWPNTAFRDLVSSFAGITSANRVFISESRLPKPKRPPRQARAAR